MKAPPILSDLLPVASDRQPPEGVSLLEAATTAGKGACAAWNMKVWSVGVPCVLLYPQVACTPFWPVLRMVVFLVDVMCWVN